ncbi:uncharacterized protein F5147DRAFT_690148 [Suillus discolor]|uniref:Uncharacterized protein n=1 Tax=Suillus discolor TaxID=1912936 RepID=A0A9P7JVJ1_9AGAM|nr:uncharacterized protein F5147DRAFT_690148 [Suillus discolor]KAG2110335.1 hypothetical protein F5147DRAFT_690148 [Suillus discolor]
MRPMDYCTVNFSHETLIISFLIILRYIVHYCPCCRFGFDSQTRLPFTSAAWPSALTIFLVTRCD